MTMADFISARRWVRTLLAAATLPLSVSITLAQAQPFREPGVPRHRMDYRTLGYPHYDEIPGDAAYITALAAGADRIYGATSGVQSYLFAYRPDKNRVQPLGRIADAQGVHHSLAVDPAGVVYIGTGKNMLKSFTIKPDLSFGLNHISQDLWTQVKEHYAGYDGGHILRYDPSSEARTSRPDQPATVTDFGVAVAGEGIYCMTLDPGRQVLYGITYPRAHFFLYDLKAGRVENRGSIFKDVLFGGPDDRTLRTLPRALVVADSGDVYTSTDGGHLLRFDPAKGELQTLKATIPGEAMQVVEARGQQFDAMVTGADGAIFMGESDRGGHLFFYIP